MWKEIGPNGIIDVCKGESTTKDNNTNHRLISEIAVNQKGMTDKRTDKFVMIT